MSREVMQMALDALDQITPDWRTSIDKHEQLNNSTEALRAALAQPEQKPVAHLNVDEDGDVKSMEWKPDMPPGIHALYAAPQSREWIGLTDEDISGCINEVTNESGFLAGFAIAIEAKLKKKNL